MDKQEELKQSIWKSDKSIADLARRLNVNYEVLSRKLNGRSELTPSLEEKIKFILKEWDIEV